MTSVLITGAGGFIGRYVATAAQQAGLRVTALGRKPVPGVNIVCDLRAPLPPLPAVDWVFHLAGAYAGAGVAELRGTDEIAARNLLQWGLAAGIRNWVFSSAAEVYGAVVGLATEDTAPRPIIPYGRVKLEVEGLFRDFAAKLPGSRIIILRIGEVYGRGGRLLGELSARFRRGFCPWFGSGAVPVSFVHVEDVSRAFVCAAKQAVSGVHTWNVADNEPLEWRDFLGHIAAALGSRPPVFLPLALANLYAFGSTLAARAAGQPPVVTGHVVRLLTTPKALSNDRLRRDVGFEFLYPDCRTGLKEALDGLPNHAENG